MNIPSKNYFPTSWAKLERSLQSRFRVVATRLQAALAKPQPGYDQLAGFDYQGTLQIKVRASVVKAVRRRPRRSYNMTHEIACFQKSIREGTYRSQPTIYASACAVRRHLFGTVEPLRAFDMTITYHAKWMRIVPPVAGDPVFAGLPGGGGAGPALHAAINLYLVLLTAHPFTDGNGRTSRLMFNLHLAEALGLTQHYIPLSELTRASHGIYEECIANACMHGDFRQLVWFLLGLLEAYALFLEHKSPPPVENDLERVIRIVAGGQASADAFGINDMAPFPVSVDALAERAGGPPLHRPFIDSALQIAAELAAYGEIRFALTGLADLTPSGAPAGGAIAFFIDARRKEELLLHFRELRARFSRSVRLQVAIASGDPVLDAKLLVSLVSHYTGHDPAAANCPVFLHGFGNSGQSGRSQSDELIRTTALPQPATALS